MADVFQIDAIKVRFDGAMANGWRVTKAECQSDYKYNYISS